MSALQQVLLGYGGAAGGPTYATWNPSDKSSDITLSGSDLVATRGAAANAFRSVRATISKTAGKWYFEFTRSAGSDKSHIMFGMMLGSTSLSQYPGQVSTGIGNQPLNTTDVNRYQNGFNNTINGQLDVGIGGVFQIAVDMDNLKVWCRVVGATNWMGNGDPASGTNQTFTLPGATAIFPAVGLFSNTTAVTANFGASSFSGTVPSGFNAGWYT